MTRQTRTAGRSTCSTVRTCGRRGRRRRCGDGGVAPAVSLLGNSEARMEAMETESVDRENGAQGDEDGDAEMVSLNEGD